jgi:hypothetical protein
VSQDIPFPRTTSEHVYILLKKDEPPKKSDFSPFKSCQGIVTKIKLTPFDQARPDAEVFGDVTLRCERSSAPRGGCNLYDATDLQFGHRVLVLLALEVDGIPSDAASISCDLWLLLQDVARQRSKLKAQSNDSFSGLSGSDALSELWV